MTHSLEINQESKSSISVTQMHKKYYFFTEEFFHVLISDYHVVHTFI
jgi:hypothetical protein